MLTSLLLLAATAYGQTATDPLAPARQGKIQCVVPNTEKKTCVGTTSYVFAADGSYKTTTRLLLNPEPAIIMEVANSGAVKDGKACEVIKLSDFEAAPITVAGQPADDGTAGAIRGQLGAMLGQYDGKTNCATSKPVEGGMLLNEVAIDGTAHPELSQKFIWVDPKDGYTLGM
jgi:hypothetical protein